MRSKNLSLNEALTWLRIVHSEDWCLRLAIRTPSGACHERRKRRRRRRMLFGKYVHTKFV